MNELQNLYLRINRGYDKTITEMSLEAAKMALICLECKKIFLNVQCTGALTACTGVAYIVLHISHTVP